MHFTSAEINTWVGAFIWPFVRIAAMTMTAPLLSARSVPVRVRLGIALAITLVVAPMLPAMPQVAPFSVAALLILFQQMLIGIIFGFIIQLVFSAIITAGQLIALQMGLGFAAMVDPQNGKQVPVVSQFYLMMMTLVFLALNGHLILIEVLVNSFKFMPIASTGLLPANFWQLALWGGHVFSGAVSISLPAIASLLIVNLAFGVMTRAAPQINIFSIGFPLTMLLGFAVMLVTLPSALPQSEQLWRGAFNLLRALSGGG